MHFELCTSQRSLLLADLARLLLLLLHILGAVTTTYSQRNSVNRHQRDANCDADVDCAVSATLNYIFEVLKNIYINNILKLLF